MNKKKIIPAVLVITVFVAGAVYLVRHQHKVLAAEAPPSAWTINANAHTLTTSRVSLSRPAVADVEAIKATVLASRLTGYVTSLPLFEGARFKRGEVLATITMSQTDAAQGNSLKSDLAAAQSALMAEQERLQRSKKLYQIGGVSLEQVQASTASVAAAQSRLTVAQENLHNATLVAPFDGVIAARLAQPGDMATPGKPLLRIVAMGAQRVLVDMPDSTAVAGLRIAGKVYPVQPWPEATAQGLRRWEARVDNLLPGSKLNVDVVTFTGEGVFIHNDCMLNNDGRRADLVRLPTDNKQAASIQHVDLLATGVEGVIAAPVNLVGARIACASPDVLNRLAAGAPYHIGEDIK